MPDLKEWGIYIYMAADVPQQGARNAARHNLNQIANIGSSDQVGVVVQIDLSGAPTRRYIIPARPKYVSDWVVQPAWTHADINSADITSISDFFTWATANCPARNIMFVLFGHGYGLDDYNPFLPKAPKVEVQTPLGVKGAVGSTLGVISAPMISTTKALPFGRSSTYRLIVDQTHKSVLNNNEVGDVIRRCRSMLPDGQNLAILGFDCCVMAMAEAWAEMACAADIGIGSQAGLPYASWPYDLFLARLLSKPQSRPQVVAEILVDSFVEFYNAEDKADYVTLSASDLELCSGLETAVKPLAEALVAVSGDLLSRNGIFSARNSCPSYDPDGYIDLDCFCAFLESDVSDDRIRRGCRSVRSALNKFVIKSGYSPNDPDKMISLSKGVSIWFPPWIEDASAILDQKQQSEAYLWNGYGDTRFALSTGWDKFLQNMQKNNS